LSAEPARAYLLVDSSGTILQRRGAEKRYAIASIAKLCTALVAFEHKPLDHPIRISANTVLRNNLDRSAPLRKGEVYSMRDMLTAMLVSSTNVSAVSIAESIAGGETRFVPLLNGWAAREGLNDTTFSDVFGMSPRTQSSLEDLSKILDLLDANQALSEIVQKVKYQIHEKNGRLLDLETTNGMTHYRGFRIYGKTGTTKPAGQCFAGFADSGHRKYKIIVLGSENVHRDMRLLLDGI